MIIHDIKERLLSNSYYLYKIKGFKRKWRRFVNDDTGIVIEGYPRCANSLLVDSFIISQDYRVRVASHSHHWAQVIEGLKKDLPVVVTIRKPVDAAASLLLRRSEISDNTALHVYEVFHRKILPHKDRILFVKFEDVIESPSRVIAIINERFGTNYIIPSDVLVEEFGAKSIRHEISVNPINGMLKVCYPNDEKKKKSMPIKERLRSHPMMPQLEALYRECLNTSL
jgi:hypothetical protein